MNVVENRNRMWFKSVYMRRVFDAISFLMPKRFAKKKLQKLCFKTGWISMAWRVSLLKRLGAKLNDEEYIIIQPEVWISNPQGLTVGQRVTINDRSYLECKGGLQIGNDVLIGHDVSILTNSHNHSEVDIPINRQGETMKQVTIGNNVWIGAKVTILMGVSIGDNTIIGANAVVTKSVPEGVIVAGVPAKVIKNR